MAVACAVVGLVASTAAAYVHFRLLSDPGYRSFCDINSAINCTELYRSRFGSVHGIPVALLGLLAAQWARREHKSDDAG